MVIEHIANKIIGNILSEIHPDAVFKREFPGLIKILGSSPQQTIDEVFDLIKKEEEIKLE